MTRKIIIVREADMLQSALYSAGQAPSTRQLNAALKSINEVALERRDFEATQERKKNGVTQVAQSNDIKNVLAMIDNVACARMYLATQTSIRGHLFPQSQPNGKSSNETSSLKGYEKFRQIAEVIFNDASDMQGVAKVFAVCAYKFGLSGKTVLSREYCESFLNSREFANLDTGTASLWNDIDDIRKKEMTGGAPTQSSQMIRNLVAMKGGADIKNGKNKDFEIFPNSPIVQAMMIRLGQIEV